MGSRRLQGGSEEIRWNVLGQCCCKWSRLLVDFEGNLTLKKRPRGAAGRLGQGRHTSQCLRPSQKQLEHLTFQIIGEELSETDMTASNLKGCFNSLDILQHHFEPLNTWC